MRKTPQKWQKRIHALPFKRWWFKHPAAFTEFVGARLRMRRQPWRYSATPVNPSRRLVLAPNRLSSYISLLPRAEKAKTRRSGFSARRGTRTLTSLRTLDPESSLSTNFSTRAQGRQRYNKVRKRQQSIASTSPVPALNGNWYLEKPRSRTSGCVRLTRWPQQKRPIAPRSAF